jgi:hypothetical protein
MNWAVTEAAMSMVYLLTWQRLLTRKRGIDSSFPVICTQPYVISITHMTQASQGGTLVNPSRLSEKDNKQNL